MLAAHLYRYDELPSGGRKRKYSTILEGGQKVNFVAYAEGDKLFIEISYRETKVLKALALFARKLKYELLGAPRRASGSLGLVLAPVTGVTARQLGYTLAASCLLTAFVVVLLWQHPVPVEVAQNARRANNANIVRTEGGVIDSPQAPPATPKDTSGDSGKQFTPAVSTPPGTYAVKSSWRGRNDYGVPPQRPRKGTAIASSTSLTQVNKVNSSVVGPTILPRDIIGCKAQ